MTTGYRPRTDVERWQLQDRLTARLRDLGLAAPRFYERAGRLVFGLKRGRGLTPDLLRRLEAIDAGPGERDAV